MKKALLISLCLTFCVMTAAQVRSRISGTVVEEETDAPVVQAGVLLLSVRDSSVLQAVVTDNDGKFAIPASPGDYILKISCLGFAVQALNVHAAVSREGMDLGSIVLARSNLGLEASVVTENAPPLTVKEDTLIYNAAAVRVAEDATLEEMLKKIPGMEVSSNGTVTLNGKEVKQLRINGKRYFGDNVKAGIKNLPADMVENIFAYDSPSDFSRISGIDDGEEEPVLDIKVKKSHMDKWKANVNVGGGTSWRYSGRFNANKITKTSQQTALVNFRNLPGKISFSNTSRNQVGAGSSGNSDRGEAGYSFSREKDGLSLSGSIHAAEALRSTVSSTRSETVNASSSSFSASSGMRNYFTPDINGDFTIEWKKDKYLTVHSKVVLKYSDELSCGRTGGRSFRSDPWLTGFSPLDYLAFDVPDDPFAAIRVNGTANATASGTSRVTANTSTSVTKRSKTHRGRAITFSLSTQYTGTFLNTFGAYRTRYYRISSNPDSLLIRSNHVSDDRNFIQVSPQISFLLPLFKNWRFQAVLRTDISHYSQDKDYYDIDAVDPSWTLPTDRTRLKAWRASLPSNYEDGYFPLFSAEGTYDRYTFNTTLNLARYGKKLTMTAGVALRPQLAVLHYQNENTPRFTFNAAPNIVFKYKFTSKKILEFYYRSWLGSPSIASMLPVTNGTNPLSVSVGNPYLRSPFNQRITLSYNASDMKRRSSFVGNMFFQYTSDQVSSSTVYDEDSGVRTTTPQNIDGNWRASGSTVYNKTFPDTRFSLTNHLSAEYQNNVTNLYNSKKKQDETNVTGRMMLKELFEGSFRGRILEIILSGGVEYTDERSRLRPAMNQRPVNYLAGVSTEVSLPWKIRLESDFTASFQRGWAYDDLNRNYWIWNAEASKSFLKGKLHLRLGWYDILRSQENIVRSFGQTSRTISTYNGVTSYGLLRLMYRF